MGIDKSNPFERGSDDGTDVFIEYGASSDKIEIKTDPGVYEGVGVAVSKGLHGSLSDTDPLSGGSET